MKEIKNKIVYLFRKEIKKMKQQTKYFWTNLAIGILGLFVGADNLSRWLSDDTLTKELVIGVLCTVLAITWIIYSFYKKNK
jgi:hypothetical protein